MSIGFWQIAIVVVLVVLLFGRGKISSIMGDLAKGIKSFKKGMSDETDQSGNSKDVTNGYCNNSPLGACHILTAHFKSLKWKNPYTDHYIKNNVDSEYVLHCSNSGYPSSKLMNSQAAGYVFITNVSGSPKTMRLEMRWDNNFSGDMSKKDITVP